jgi:hypothetical protein
MEKVAVVWLFHDSSINVGNEKIKLRQIVSLVKTSIGLNECITYIINIHIEKVFLIVPTIDLCLHLIQSLEQVEIIYILTSSSLKKEKLNGQILSSNTFYDTDTRCK